MKRKFVVLMILVSMIIPSVTIDFHSNARNELPSQTALSGEPDTVTIVVHVMRERCLSLNDQTVYFTILIDGVNSMWWNQTFTGCDNEIEWPMAYHEVDYEEGKEIPIQISLWKQGPISTPCDISGAEGDYAYGKTLTIFYNLTTGEWYGDDYLGDPSGYGHCSGFEDGNYDEDDYEIWFDIYEATEGWGEDRLTYWDKLAYGLNASREYGDVDLDGDGIPCDWEDKYGYNPVVAEDHASLDPDNDGLDNVEEWKTSEWHSDPFAQDVFVEVDGMKAKHPWQDDYMLPRESQYMIMNEFVKHNISLHFDDGNMGGGGDLIPYDDKMWGDELEAARLKYFLNGDPDNWRRGVFHYGLICCQMGWYGRPAGGRMFYIDSCCVGAQYVRNWLPLMRLQGSDYATAIASVFMHELGHTLGLFDFEGIDNEKSRFPWNKEFWEWGPYKSCMNYRYVYKYVGYSDGDDPDHDQNDWAVIKERMSRFQGDWW